MVMMDSELMMRLRAICDEACDIHDNYFTADVKDKQQKLKACQNSFEKVVKDAALSAPPTGMLLYLTGKTLNAADSYSAEAERCLTLSLKLDPSQIDAWNQLGTCQWKKRDLRSAIEAFEASQRCCPNAEALRSLSQLARLAAQQSDSSNLGAACTDSIAKAKACIALCVARTGVLPGDIDMAWAWLVLGTALLCQFISISHELEDLEKASKAFARGATLEVAAVQAAQAAGVKVRRLPDVHYSRGQALCMLEDFAASFESYTLSCTVDPALSDSVAEAVRGAKRGAARTIELIEKKCLRKTKQVAEFSVSVAVPASQGSQEAVGVGHRSQAYLRQLQTGENTGRYLRVRVLGVVDRQDPLPGTAIAVDGAGAVFALCTYHLNRDMLSHIKDKHIVTLLDPCLREIHAAPAHSSEASGGATGTLAVSSVFVRTAAHFLVTTAGDGKAVPMLEADADRTRISFSVMDR